LFCSACSATARATPDEAVPAMMFTPSPISSLTTVTALSGSPASSMYSTLIVVPSISPVPSVA
jgi:hypothetical protein